MRYLLDSNVLIAAALASGEALRARMASCDEDDLATSAVVYAEVAHGSLQGTPPSLSVLDRILADIPVLPFDRNAARVYAALPFVRGSFDRLIAAHALSLGLIVITDNIRHFAALPGLRVENWTE